MLSNNSGGKWTLLPETKFLEHERTVVSCKGPEHVVGVSLPRADPNDRIGLVMSLVKRVSPTTPPLERTEELAEMTRKICGIYLPVMCDSDIIPFEEYVAELDKPEAFKEEVRQAHRNRLRNHDYAGSRKLKSFTKEEGYTSFKANRLIQGISSDSTRRDLNSYYARIIKSMERVVYPNLPGLVKGMTPHQRSIVIKGLGESCFRSDNDYSSYEASFIEEKMSCVQLELYRYLLGGVTGGDALFNGIKEVITGENRLEFSGLLRFTVKSRKMSGDPDTALSNAFDNLVCLVLLLVDRGCSIEQALAMFFVEGDDNVGCYGIHTLSNDDFLPLGLRAKARGPADCLHPEMSGFCQLYSVPNSDVIVKDPWKALANLGTVPNKYRHASDKVFKSLLRATAMSELYLHAGAPVVSVLAAKKLELTRGVNIRDKHVAEILRGKSYTIGGDFNWRDAARVEISMESRVLVETAFGMTVDMQLYIEEAIQKWTGGGLNLPLEWFPEEWVIYADNYTSNDADASYVMPQTRSRVYNSAWVTTGSRPNNPV